MTKHKLPISGPITSPARCLNCGLRTFAYLGDPLAATGLWKCSGCKWRQIGVRPAFDPKPPRTPEPTPPPEVRPNAPDAPRAKETALAGKKAATGRIKLPPGKPPPTMATVNANNPRPPRTICPVQIGEVVRIVCEECRVDPVEILTKCRHLRVVMARRLIVRLGRDLTNLSFPELALVMAPESKINPAPNHSVAISAIKRFEVLKGYMVRQLLAADDPISPAFGDETLDALRVRLSLVLVDSKRHAQAGKTSSSTLGSALSSPR